MCTLIMADYGLYHPAYVQSSTLPLPTSGRYRDPTAVGPGKQVAVSYSNHIACATKFNLSWLLTLTTRPTSSKPHRWKNYVTGCGGQSVERGPRESLAPS